MSHVCALYFFTNMHGVQKVRSKKNITALRVILCNVAKSGRILLSGRILTALASGIMLGRIWLFLSRILIKKYILPKASNYYYYYYFVHLCSFVYMVHHSFTCHTPAMTVKWGHPPFHCHTWSLHIFQALQCVSKKTQQDLISNVWRLC